MSGTSNVKHASTVVGDSMSTATVRTSASSEGGSEKGHFYKPLAKEFRRDGFTYRQIAREGEAAIYEQKWGGWSEPSIAYEVIRVQR